jgi:putative DNA primase/helicase
MITYFNSEIKNIDVLGANEIFNNNGPAIFRENDDPIFRAKELLILNNSGTGINFQLTNELALECIDDILEHWLPDGEQRGAQYVSYNPTRNDGSLGSFTINTEKGIWADFACDDKGGDLISLISYLDGCEYQSEGAVNILEFLAGIATNDKAALIRSKTIHKVITTPEYSIVMPIPDEEIGRRPNFFGNELGSPATTWEYRNNAGKIMCYVHRFDLPNGKSFRPQTFCEDSSGWGIWRNSAPPTPRPAYGLDHLAASPDAPVMFTEGEKSADAAQRLFPEFVAVTTMNGSQSPEKTDFSPVAGRKVYIAPDNDDAGTAYKEKLIRLLRSAGAEVVAVMRLDLLVKDGVPLSRGYDLADAEVGDWTPELLSGLGSDLWEPVEVIDPLPPTLPPLLPSGQTKMDGGFKYQEPPKKKSDMERANEFAMSNYAGHLAHFNNQTLAYKDGYWAALNPDVHMKLPILRALGDSASNAKVSGICELVKIKYAKLPEEFERTSALICLNNGTLNPVTGELLAHSVDHRLTNKVDITFNTAAECPLWMQTLDEIFAPDLDKNEKIQLLQEYIGYCLIPDTRIHKFLWMVGGGGNGKSLILEIITALIGKVNISYAQIERLQEKFVRAELQGKLVNISSEMSAQATIADGYLKQITAGDVIEAERKNERPFSFKPYSRLIGATNVLPRLLDHSDGFFRRALILRFNRQFTEANQDTQRKTRLMAELPGILNWAVSGLQNLLMRTFFIIPASSEAEVAQYRVHSDPVRQFSDDFLTPTEDKSNMVRGEILYNRYKSWSIDNGYKVLASNQFAERLSGVGIAKGRDKEGRFWRAIYFEYGFLPLSLDKKDSPLSKKYNI